MAIAKAVELELGERRGRPSKENTENFPELNSDKGKETRQIAAEKAGFGNETTYRQAKKVVETGTLVLVNALDENRINPFKCESTLKGKS